jgi:hypothetical protein
MKWTENMLEELLRLPALQHFRHVRHVLPNGRVQHWFMGHGEELVIELYSERELLEK